MTLLQKPSLNSGVSQCCFGGMPIEQLGILTYVKSPYVDHGEDAACYKCDHFYKNLWVIRVFVIPHCHKIFHKLDYVLQVKIIIISIHLHLEKI